MSAVICAFVKEHLIRSRFKCSRLSRGTAKGRRWLAICSSTRNCGKDRPEAQFTVFMGSVRNQLATKEPQ